MNCKQAQRLLVPYINGELDEKEEGEFVKTYPALSGVL
ncbi:MAG: zf-HC2 domain-containing protein [Lachnospiraceae bacterium]